MSQYRHKYEGLGGIFQYFADQNQESKLAKYLEEELSSKYPTANTGTPTSLEEYQKQRQAAIDAEMRAKITKEFSTGENSPGANPYLTTRFQGQEKIELPTDGQTQAGNVNLFTRPTVKEANGIATVKSMGANVDGKEVLLPTISQKGEQLTPKQAIDAYRQTGENLGTFETPEQSTTYAKALSAQQGQMYGNKMALPGIVDANLAKTSAAVPNMPASQQPAQSDVAARFKKMRDAGIPPMVAYAQIQKEQQDAQTNAQMPTLLTALHKAQTTGNPADITNAIIQLQRTGVDVSKLFSNFDYNRKTMDVDTGDRKVILTEQPATGNVNQAAEIAKGINPEALMKERTDLYKFNNVSGNTRYTQNQINMRQDNKPEKEDPEEKKLNSYFDSKDGMKDAQRVDIYQGMTQSQVNEAAKDPEWLAQYNMSLANYNKHVESDTITKDEAAYLQKKGYTGLKDTPENRKKVKDVLRIYRGNRLRGIKNE